MITEKYIKEELEQVRHDILSVLIDWDTFYGSSRKSELKKKMPKDVFELYCLLDDTANKIPIYRE